MDVDAIPGQLGKVVFHHCGADAVAGDLPGHHACGAAVLFKDLHLIAQGGQGRGAAQPRRARPHHGHPLAVGLGQGGGVGRVGAGVLLEIPNVDGRAAAAHGTVFLAQLLAGAKGSADAPQGVGLLDHPLGALHVGIAQVADELGHVHRGGTPLLAGRVHTVQAAPGLRLDVFQGLVDCAHSLRLLYLRCMLMACAGQMPRHKPQPSHFSLSTMARRSSSRWMAL